MTQSAKTPTTAPNTDAFPINGTDYIELLVGNARQSALFYQTAMGFQPLAYAGLSYRSYVTGSPTYSCRTRSVSCLLRRLSRAPISAALIDRHGDTVRAVALWVDDATAAFETATARGAEAHYAPKEESDGHGRTIRAAVKSYGDTIHVFVERSNYEGVFPARLRSLEPRVPHRAGRPEVHRPHGR